MKDERLKEILNRLEQSPDMPLMMLQDQEAAEAIERVARTYHSAHLVTLRGISYIAITDAALEVILEQLERERVQFAKTLENYDRNIAGIKELLQGGKRNYWAQDCTVPEPAIAEKGEK